MADVRYGDTLQLRSTSGGYLCYKPETKAYLAAASTTTGYSTKFVIYNHDWNATDAIPYAGGKVDSSKASGNFRLSCLDVPDSKTIVAPHYDGSVGDDHYAALRAHTDRDGADKDETFFFIKPDDNASTAAIQYGDEVRIYNYSKSKPFLRVGPDGSLLCTDPWAGSESFVVEQVLEQNV